MSLTPFYHEAQVRVGEDDLRFVLNFRTIDAIEGLVGLPMPSILPQLIVGDVPYGLIGKVVWGLLREHHPEVTLDEAAGLMFDPEASAGVGVVIGDLFKRGFHLGEDAEKPKGQNPRKRRGASETSSRSGSRQKLEA